MYITVPAECRILHYRCVVSSVNSVPYRCSLLFLFTGESAEGTATADDRAVYHTGEAAVRGECSMSVT